MANNAFQLFTEWEVLVFLLFCGAAVAFVLTIIALGLTTGMSAKIKRGEPTRAGQTTPSSAPRVLALLAVIYAALGVLCTVPLLTRAAVTDGLALFAVINFVIDIVILRKAIGDHNAGSIAMQKHYGSHGAPGR